MLAHGIITQFSFQLEKHMQWTSHIKLNANKKSNDASNGKQQQQQQPGTVKNACSNVQNRDWASV